MAYKTNSSLFAQLFVITILLAVAGQALGGRAIPKEVNNENMKQPEWLDISDPSFLIPGIGRVMAPPACRFSPHNPFSDHTGAPFGEGAGPTGSYLPGGDDTFFPNPGSEVPNPGATHP